MTAQPADRPGPPEAPPPPFETDLPAPLPLVDLEPWDGVLELRGRDQGLLVWGGAPAAEGPPSLGDRPVIVLLHGFLDQAGSWHDTAAALAGHGAVVLAPDHRGHGRSAWAGPGQHYAFADYLADLDAIFDHFDLRGAVLVGHSMGGTMAALYASLRPARVDALLLVDGLGPPALSDEDAYDTLLSFLDDQRAPRAQAIGRPLPDLAAVEARLRAIHPLRSAAAIQLMARRAVVPEPTGGHRWSADPMHKTRSAVAFDLRRFRVHLQRLRCPVRLVVGETGWYPQLPGLGRREAELPRWVGRHALPCSHHVPAELPGALAALIARDWRRLIPPDPAEISVG